MPSRKGKKPRGEESGPSRRKIEERALGHLVEIGCLRDPVVVHVESARTPGDVELFKVTAAPRDEPNGDRESVVVDATGSPIDEARLAELDVFRSPRIELLPIGPRRIKPAPITIDPCVNELTLRECESFVETITVTVPKQHAAMADVYFLADTTGSMGSEIAAVKAGAATILNDPALAGYNVAFGVGNYKDFPYDPYAFQHQVSPQGSSQAAVLAAISTWTAAGGGDGPEGQLFALYKLATDPAIGWRPCAKKIVVWFGDVPGHEPICQAISGLPNLTLADVQQELQAADITVLAISTSSPGLDGDPKLGANDYGACTPGGSPGQATALANATGGTHVTVLNPASLAQTILLLIQNAVATINNLSLVPTGAAADFVTGISPAGGYGPLPGDKEHVLKFRVHFTGKERCRSEPQTFLGAIDVIADCLQVTRKPVIITVPACRYHYAVKFVCGTQHPERCHSGPVRPGIYATEINLFNPNGCAASVEKEVIPVVYNGKVIGREPRWSSPRGRDRILLPPNGATMDDCLRLGELLVGRPPCQPRLTIGFLSIWSDKPLEIRAVYTASDLKGRLVTMDVESIEGRHI